MEKNNYAVANTKEELESQNNNLESKYFEENWDIWDINDDRVAQVNTSVNKFIKELDSREERSKFKERLIQLYLKCMKDLRNSHFLMIIHC